MNITEKILSTDFGAKWLEGPIPVMKVLNVLQVSHQVRATWHFSETSILGLDAGFALHRELLPSSSVPTQCSYHPPAYKLQSSVLSEEDHRLLGTVCYYTAEFAIATQLRRLLSDLIR